MMAESQKGAFSSSADPKDTKSSLDKDLGKEFLGSWKSMSVAEDDPMDFIFDAVPTGKKKAFNFDKLNMDFNLEGDFDKFSSFKVDMPELDFSSPTKRTEKSKEGSEGGSSTEDCRGKKDSFSFSFDFNELDNFNFGPSLKKAEKTSTKKVDGEGVAKVRSDCEGSENDLLMHIDPFDDAQTKKPPARMSALTSMTAAGLEAVNSMHDNFASGCDSIGDQRMSCGAKSSAATVILEETDQEKNIIDQPMLAESCSQENTKTLPLQSHGVNVSTQDIVTDKLPDACVFAENVNTESGAEQNVCDQMIACAGSAHEISAWKNSAPCDITVSDSNRGEGEKTDGRTLMEKMVVAETPVTNLNSEVESSISLSGIMLEGREATRDDHDSASKLSVPVSGASVVDKGMPAPETELGVVPSKFFDKSKENKFQSCKPSSNAAEVSPLGRKGVSAMRLSHSANGTSASVVDKGMPTPEKELGVVPLKFFNKSKENEFQSCQPSSNTISPLGSKGVSAMHLSHSANGTGEVFNANLARRGRKLVDNPKPLSGELIKVQPASLGSEKNAKNLRNIREVLGGGAQSFSKLGVNLRPPDKELIKQDSVELGSEKNIKDGSNPGSDVNPVHSTTNTTKSNTKTSANPTVSISSKGSVQNRGIISVEGVRSGRTISRNSDDQPVTTLHKEINSLKNLKKTQGSSLSKIVHPVANAERKSPLITSLKRKASEASNADADSLNLHKRLSQSPSESRSFNEPPKTVFQEQADSKTNIILHDPTSGLEISQEVHMKELEISLEMENSGNVEKAESYAKELEDICNMLKKKHEEAKEVLVRAIVNNNHLLMLNHPMFDGKISLESLSGLLVNFSCLFF